ncbi:hypothetical protein M5K25_024480 [Dendrobium thyrsiflorum]|uniref:FH2 domain-containing protein n=1 Tax=Dendrobium thyrsiflorum TaxID=117978 RepID=A0ABD0U2H7_DENTH
MSSRDHAAAAAVAWVAVAVMTQSLRHGSDLAPLSQRQNTENLGSELLDTLLKMAHNKEQEAKLREYKDDSPVKLGPAEKFLKALLDIPFTFKRVDVMLYIINFDSEVN